MIASAVLVSLILGIFVFSHRYAWWRRSVDWRQPRVLMYHMISSHRPNAKFNKLRVSQAKFAEQVKWLVDNNFHFVSMHELYTQWAQLPVKTVALTFDDGFADNLHAALPILKKYNAKATIYIVVDRHDRDWSTYKKAHHNSGELARETKLTDKEIQELVSSGLIEIGSHTLTHANLPKLSTSERREEMESSRILLQQVTGQPVTSFAYPFGIYSPADVSAARQAGYTNAVTTVEGIDLCQPAPDFLQLRRIKVSGKDNLFGFICRMKTGQRGL